MKKSDRTDQLDAALRTLASNKSECKYVTCVNIVKIINDDDCYEELIDRIKETSDCDKGSAVRKGEWIRRRDQLYDERFGGMCGGAMDYVFLFKVRNKDNMLKKKVYKCAVRSASGNYLLVEKSYRDMSVVQLKCVFDKEGGKRSDKEQFALLEAAYASSTASVYGKVDVFNFNGWRYEIPELADIIKDAADHHGDPDFAHDIVRELERVLKHVKKNFPKKKKDK